MSDPTPVSGQTTPTIVAINDCVPMMVSAFLPSTFTGCIIISNDDVYDSADTVTFFDGHPLRDPAGTPEHLRERNVFERSIRERLGVDPNGINLRHIATYFDSLSRARYLIEQGAGDPLALWDLATAAREASSGLFNNEVTKAQIASMAKEVITPELETIESIISMSRFADPSFTVMESMLRGFVLYEERPHGEALLQLFDSETLDKITALRQPLLTLALRVFSGEATHCLDEGHSQRYLASIYGVLNAIEGAAVEAGVSFDKGEIDGVLQRLRDAAPSIDAQ